MPDSPVKPPTGEIPDVAKIDMAWQSATRDSSPLTHKRAHKSQVKPK